jgi:hypothetical protein
MRRLSLVSTLPAGFPDRRAHLRERLHQLWLALHDQHAVGDEAHALARRLELLLELRRMFRRQRREARRGQGALVMFAFGVGAAAPLLAVGLMSREALTRIRGKRITAGGDGRMLLGAVLVLIGAAVLAGLEKRLEAALVAASPDWLTELTTRF